MAAQMKDEERFSRVRYIIRNDGEADVELALNQVLFQMLERRTMQD